MTDSLFEMEDLNCLRCGRPLHDGKCPWCDMPPTPTKHLHRRKGPDTSVAAAQSVNPTDLEVMVLTAIEEAGEAGMTADELLDTFPGYSYSSITARPAALKRKGLILDSGRKRSGKSGRAQAVLVASKFRTSESHEAHVDPVPVPTPDGTYPGRSIIGVKPDGTPIFGGHPDGYCGRRDCLICEADPNTEDWGGDAPEWTI
jgi:hypothetical protein